MERWTGVFQVKSLPGCDVLDGDNGAFVNVVALAKDERHFKDLVLDTMNEYDLEVIGVEDLHFVDDRIMDRDCVPELKRLCLILTKKYPIQFGEFYTFEDD